MTATLKTLAIAARACVSKFLDSDDIGVAGIYTASVDASLPESHQASAILDKFHSSVPVSTLDDFDFVVFDPASGLVIESSDVEDYTMGQHAHDLVKADDNALYVFMINVHTRPAYDKDLSFKPGKSREFVAHSLMDAKQKALAYERVEMLCEANAVCEDASLGAPDHFVKYSPAESKDTAKSFWSTNGWTVLDHATQYPDPNGIVPIGDSMHAVVDGQLKRKTYGFDVDLKAFISLDAVTPEEAKKKLLELLDAATCFVIDDRSKAVKLKFEASASDSLILREIDSVPVSD